MKKILLCAISILCFQTIVVSQVNSKSKAEILKEIEWLSTTPVEKSDKEFLSKTSDIIKFQFIHHPNFPLN